MIELNYSIADRKCYSFDFKKKKYRVWVVDGCVSMEDNKGVIMNRDRHTEKFDQFLKELSEYGTR